MTMFCLKGLVGFCFSVFLGLIVFGICSSLWLRDVGLSNLLLCSYVGEGEMKIQNEIAGYLLRILSIATLCYVAQNLMCLNAL